MNVASGESLAIETLAKKIQRQLGINKPAVSLGKPQTGNPTHWLASIDRYQKLTGDLSVADFDGDLQECLRTWKEEIG